MTAVLAVSIDASAVPRKPGGAGRYVLELVPALRRRHDLELTVVARGGDGARWSDWSGPGAAPVVEWAPRARVSRLAWEQAVLPRLLANAHFAVHHGPHYTMPEAARLPKVVTVHDLTFFDNPEWHARAKVVFFRRAIRVAARRADAVIAVSRVTAERLADLEPRAPVTVIPHGVDHDRLRPLDPDHPIDAAVAEADLAARRRVGVGEQPYLLFVGTIEPRKDVPTLVRAFSLVAAAHPGVELVLAGADGWGVGAVDTAISASPHAGRIRRAGYITEDDKAALLRGALAAAYPSRVEGFGLPALEAMACGTPVVTTAGTAMAEVTGDAALLVPGGDSDALAQALEAVLAGGPDLEDRRRRGLVYAAGYTWDASAAAHAGVYHSLVG